MEQIQIQEELWPELPYEAWKETYATLHMFTQIVGKLSLKLGPIINHWWETAFLVTPRGLITYPIYYDHGSFDIEFNFKEHALVASNSLGEVKKILLENHSVASFYEEFKRVLSDLGIHAKIDVLPQEVENGIPFPKDSSHHSYDRRYVENFHRILIQADRLMKEFRADFIGKCSPVHFFWGSFDLAVTRFCGKTASLQNVDRITAEAYSHEVISCGFWPGSQNILEPAFYAYMSPEPNGFGKGEGIRPQSAFYNPTTKNFILKYEDVRHSPNPDQMVKDFFQSTYELGAELAHWDRDSLERSRQKLH